MTQIEALKEAITALSNSETLSRRCAHESFTADSDRKYWLQAAVRAKDARNVLVDVLQPYKRRNLMNRFDRLFKQLVIKENAIPMGCEMKTEKLFEEFIRVNGCPASNTYDDYKKEFLQEVIKKGFELTEEQIHFNYDIHFINQEGDDKDTIGSFFYCIHPFFLNGEMLWHAFGIFGSWKTGEIHYYRAENKRPLPPDNEYVISREICKMLNEAVNKCCCNSEPEPLEIATDNPFNDWHKATAKDVNNLSLIYLSTGAYGIRQLKLTILIPIRDITGKLTNLQRIYADGNSEFQIDSNIDGGFHRIGIPIDNTIYISKTYQTGAKFHDQTTHAVAVAFCKENMENVRDVLKEKYPDYELLLIDDNGEVQETNPSSDPTPEE